MIARSHARRFALGLIYGVLLACCAAWAEPPRRDGGGPPGMRSEIPAMPGQAMGAGHGPGGPGEMLPSFLRGVELSEAQRDRLFELAHAQLPSMRQRTKSWQKAEAELRILVRSADYSEAKAKALVDGIVRAQGELQLARVRLERQAYEVLTPEQRRQLADRPLPPKGPPGLAEREAAPCGAGDDRRPPPRP